VMRHRVGESTLLSREGEVEIAKKIEEGEKQVIDEVLSSPLALSYVLDLGQKLANHEIRVREIIKEDGEDDGEYLEDEEVHEKRLIDQISKIRRNANECEKIKGQLENKRVSAPRRQDLLEVQAKYHEKIVNGLKALQLNRRQTEAIADGLKKALDRMQTLEKRIKDYEQKTGKSAPEILKLVASLNGRKKNWNRVVGSLRMGHEAILAMAEEIKNARRDLRRIEKDLEIPAD
jgi:RNA polymerase primary sigma factor